MRIKYLSVGLVVGVLLSLTAIALAGNLDPTDPPASTTSYTLEDIYSRLHAGTAGSPTTFTEPASGPGTGTMHTLNDIMGAAPAADDADGVAPGEVLAGKTYWGVRSSAWGPQMGTAVAGNNVDGPEGARVFNIPDGFYWTKEAAARDADLLAGNIRQGVNIFGVSGTVIQATGDATPPDVLTGKTFSNAAAASLDGTMPNRGAVVYTPTTANQAIAEGYHNGSGYVQGDADLVAGNIKQGVDLFGVNGTLYSAGVPKTGQTTSFAAGDDGDLERGVVWPNPRFTDNGNGTVTDNLTGLIWLKDANCFGQQTWANALSSANTLNSGECSLSDGSVEGNWRLPNVRELHSLIHYGVFAPALPNTAGTGKWSDGDPFTGVQLALYWSSATHIGYTPNAWLVGLTLGDVTSDNKTVSHFVWPVRGGQ